MTEDQADELVDILVTVIDERIILMLADKLSAEERNLATTRDYEARSRLASALAALEQEKEKAK